MNCVGVGTDRTRRCRFEAALAGDRPRQRADDSGGWKPRCPVRATRVQRVLETPRDPYIRSDANPDARHR